MTIVIHHLHASQSERIPWLCEELGIDYELRTYDRSPLLAPPEYKKLHPMGAAPVIEDGSLTLAESCAVIEYISHRYADGRLFLQWPHPNYADFLYWWHWVDGSFFGTISRAVHAASGGGGLLATMSMDRFTKALEMLDERLRDNEWLAGSEFTVADIMVVFTLTTFRYFVPFSLQEHHSIVKYLARVGAREAYQRAMDKADHDMGLVLGPDSPEHRLM